MIHYPYLIIGGGMAAMAAVRGIRKHDAEGAIGLISSEAHAPYKRPWLSKALWAGKSLAKVWIKQPAVGAELYLSRTVVAIDRDAKTVSDDQGEQYAYGKLLLATGGEARALPFDAEGIVYFRNLDDYQRLRTLTGEKRQFLVIGGGFVGSEMAAALSTAGVDVTMIFPEPAIGSRVYPEVLSRFITDYYRERGVDVLTGDVPEKISCIDGGYEVITRQARKLSVDVVVAGLGLVCNTTLAEQAGLKVDNGILVNASLQSSDPDIYAAGDVANFYNPAQGKRMRVEHEDNANVMGELAGANMAGGNESYEHQPFFYSDLFDLGYEAVGRLDSGMDVVEDWQEPLRKGSIFYLEEGRVRGVLLWNNWGLMEKARALIADGSCYSPATDCIKRFADM